MPRRRGPRRRGGASSSRGAASSSRGDDASSSTQASPSTPPPAFNKPKFSEKWTVDEILDFLDVLSTSQCPLRPHSPRGQRSSPPESPLTASVKRTPPPSPRRVSLPPSPRDASPKTTPPPSPRGDSQPTIPPPCSMNQASPKTTPPPSTSDAPPPNIPPPSPQEATLKTSPTARSPRVVSPTTIPPSPREGSPPTIQPRSPREASRKTSAPPAPSPRQVSRPTIPPPLEASRRSSTPPATSPQKSSRPTIPPATPRKTSSKKAPPPSLRKSKPKTTPSPTPREASLPTLPRIPSEQNKAFAKWTLQESRCLISLIERHKMKVPEDRGWDVLASHLPNKTARDLSRHIFFVQLAIYFMEKLKLKSKESEAAPAADVAANGPSAEPSSSQIRRTESIPAAARTKRTVKASAASTSGNGGRSRASDQKISTVRMDRFADKEEAALDPCGNETELAPVAPPEAVGTCSDESELQQPWAPGTLVIFNNRGEPMSFPTMPQPPGSEMDSTILSGDTGDEPINEGEIEVRVPLGRISDYRFLSPLTASSSTGTPEMSAPHGYSTRGAGSNRGARERRSGR